MFGGSAVNLMDVCARQAEREDAVSQPPPLADPEAVLADEAGFRAWASGRAGNPLDLLEAYFRERTGILVCAVFPNGFAYRPKHERDGRGVWLTSQKLPKWFSRAVHTA